MLSRAVLSRAVLSRAVISGALICLTQLEAPILLRQNQVGALDIPMDDIPLVDPSQITKYLRGDLSDELRAQSKSSVSPFERSRVALAACELLFDVQRKVLSVWRGMAWRCGAMLASCGVA